MLHALAYGCAIMALDTVFTREMLADGKYGLFFTKEENNLKSLIEQIENNTEQIEHLKNVSRNRIIENYTWEKITDQYIDLFHKLIKK